MDEDEDEEDEDADDARLSGMLMMVMMMMGHRCVRHREEPSAVSARTPQAHSRASSAVSARSRPRGASSASALRSFSAIQSLWNEKKKEKKLSHYNTVTRTTINNNKTDIFSELIFRYRGGPGIMDIQLTPINISYLQINSERQFIVITIVKLHSQQ